LSHFLNFGIVTFWDIVVVVFNFRDYVFLHVYPRPSSYER